MGKPYIHTQRIRHTVGVGPVAITTTALKAASAIAVTVAQPAITFVAAANPQGGVAAPVGMEAVTVTTE